VARRRFQEGQVYKKRKNWIGRWREDIVDANGFVRRVRRARVIGSIRELPTKPLVRRRLQQFLAPVNDPAYRPGRIATLVEFAERWQQEVLSQCKRSSINAAKSHLRTHILPTLGNLRLDQIGPEVQQAFVTRIAPKVARKTLLNVLGTLSAIMSKAKEWKFLCEPVRIQSLALPANAERRGARFFTADQVRAIIAAASQPWKTFFTLAAMSGLRAGELWPCKSAISISIGA
jgi:integrase